MQGDIAIIRSKLQEIAHVVGNFEGYELNRIGLKLWNQGVSLSHKSSFSPELNVQGLF